VQKVKEKMSTWTDDGIETANQIHARAYEINQRLKRDDLTDAERAELRSEMDLINKYGA